MFHVITDSSALFSSKQGKEVGIIVTPLSVTIDGKSYRELDEITSETFLQIVREGHLPTSSQPAIGEVLETFEQQEGDILNISMADGLSGTYQSACSAREMMSDKERVTVVNSGSLCGPHRYLVNRAKEFAREGLSITAALQRLEASLNNHKSFLIPMDFDFLRRGGRLAPLAAQIGGLLHLVPLMAQTRDGKKIEKAGLSRNFKGALDQVIKSFEKIGVGAGHLITVSHADAQGRLKDAVDRLAKAFPYTEIEVLELSPAFITQGGPGCVAVQAILKSI